MCVFVPFILVRVLMVAPSCHCGSGALCLSVCTCESLPRIWVRRHWKPLLLSHLPFSIRPPSGSLELNLANKCLSASKDNIRPSIRASFKQIAFIEATLGHFVATANTNTFLPSLNILSNQLWSDSSFAFRMAWFPFIWTRLWKCQKLLKEVRKQKAARPTKCLLCLIDV